MAKLKSYRELEVWKKSMELVESVYKLTEKLPSDQKFGLCSQIQRAAVSIPSNIAEGYGRGHRKEYIYHLSIANGSLAELETQLLILHRLDYITKGEIKPIWAVTQEIGKMLRVLTETLKRKK